MQQSLMIAAICFNGDWTFNSVVIPCDSQAFENSYMMALRKLCNNSENSDSDFVE